MPWSPSDGPARHTKKANTPATKKQWSDIANKVLAEGGPDAEGKAVRIANSQVKKHPSHKQVGLAKAPGE
jgi:hypothetical protein